MRAAPLLVTVSLAEIRKMFDKRHEKRLAKQYEAALAKRQAEHDGYAEPLRLAETFPGA